MGRYHTHRVASAFTFTRSRTDFLRLILQRVRSAAVFVGPEAAGRIGRGLLALVAVESGDDAEVAGLAARRLATLRLFEDERGKTNLDAAAAGASILVVSQFTLLADTSRGRRPSFTRAAPPAVAEPVVESLIAALRSAGLPTECGRFGAEMRIEVTLDGPFTLSLDVPQARPAEPAGALSSGARTRSATPAKESP